MDVEILVDHTRQGGPPDGEAVRGLLDVLAGSLQARVLLVVEPDGTRSASWFAPDYAGMTADQETAIEERLSSWWASCSTDSDQLLEQTIDEHAVFLASVGTGRRSPVLLAALQRGYAPTDDDRERIAVIARVLAWRAREADLDMVRRKHLDDLVVEVATMLMGVSAATVDEVRLAVVRRLAEFFGVDTAFMRRNDHVTLASVMLAEWPERANIPVPDPLGVVPFDSPDPIFGSLRDLKEPIVVRPEPTLDDYQARVRKASGVPEVSLATVPMVDGRTTVGVLGFIKFGDREWFPEEVNALKAIAALFTQVDGRVAAEMSLQFSAFHDELTGLPNRRAFIERLEDCLRTGPVALMFVDMDRLKSMNDTFGHVAGDELIRNVGRTMAAVLKGQFVARLAGDEFVAIVTGYDSQDEVMATCDELVLALAAPVTVSGHVVSRSASVGVSFSRPATLSASELMQEADGALLEAKAVGGNSVVLFNESTRAKMEWRAELELHLREAIRENQLRLFYQPEYDLRTGRILAVEALVRWAHPVHGLLMPDSFIDIIEETNLAPDLGRWVINEALEQAAAWRAAAPDVPLGIRINISPAQMLSHKTVGIIEEGLRKHGIPGDCLCLEVTERSMVQDLDRVLSIAEQLRDLGVTLAIDDFGTGYSSYAQLKSLPVDILKIDRSFVTDLGEDERDRAIVESIVNLARSFDMELVAEGVEVAANAHVLLELGCYRAQGYLLARPLPAEKITLALKAGPLDLDELGIA
jgi:diguanylate cyclase (GGDEF)-like protein